MSRGPSEEYIGDQQFNLPVEVEKSERNKEKKREKMKGEGREKKK